jgi:chemotaxis response regulator CheB
MDLRILIVDDSITMRRITATIVGSRPGWTVCGEAEAGLSGIQKFQELKPENVLTEQRIWQLVTTFSHPHDMAA